MNEDDVEVYHHDNLLSEIETEEEGQAGGSASAASDNDNVNSRHHSTCENDTDRARDDSAEPTATGSTPEGFRMEFGSKTMNPDTPL